MGIDHLAGMRHGWMIRLRPFSTRGRCRNACLFQKGCQYEHLSGLALQQVRTPARHGDNLQAKKNPAKGRVFRLLYGRVASFPLREEALLTNPLCVATGTVPVFANT